MAVVIYQAAHTFDRGLAVEAGGVLVRCEFDRSLWGHEFHAYEPNDPRREDARDALMLAGVLLTAARLRDIDSLVVRVHGFEIHLASADGSGMGRERVAVVVNASGPDSRGEAEQVFRAGWGA